MSDIVDELRKPVLGWDAKSLLVSAETAARAADEIVRLRDEVDRLRSARRFEGGLAHPL